VLAGQATEIDLLRHGVAFARRWELFACKQPLNSTERPMSRFVALSWHYPGTSLLAHWCLSKDVELLMSRCQESNILELAKPNLLHFSDAINEI
jgi:hypothetical protein